MKRVFGMMLIACITFVGCTKVEHTQATNTQPENTQAANAQPENTQPENTKAANTQPDNQANSAANKAPAGSLTNGLQDYIIKSKVSEARTNLMLIANGAVAFYETEHYSEATDEVITNSFPVSKGIQIGPDVNESTIDKKYQISDNEYDQVWEMLYFKLSAPAYYTYSYVSDGKTARAKAAASILKACDSIFEIDLSVSEFGAMSSPIKDISETGDCSPAKLP